MVPLTRFSSNVLQKLTLPGTKLRVLFLRHNHLIIKSIQPGIHASEPLGPRCVDPCFRQTIRCIDSQHYEEFLHDKRWNRIFHSEKQIYDIETSQMVRRMSILDSKFLRFLNNKFSILKVNIISCTKRGCVFPMVIWPAFRMGQ